MTLVVDTLCGTRGGGLVPKVKEPATEIPSEGCRSGVTLVVDTLCGTRGGGLVPKVKG